MTPAEWIQSAPLSMWGADGSKTCFSVACRLLRLGCSQEEAVSLFLGPYNSRLMGAGEKPWAESDIRHKVADAAKKVGPVAKPKPEPDGGSGAGAKRFVAAEVSDEEFARGVEISLKLFSPEAQAAFAERYGWKLETMTKCRNAGSLGVRPDLRDLPRWIWSRTWQDEQVRRSDDDPKRRGAKGRKFDSLYVPWKVEFPKGVIVTEGAKDAISAAETLPSWQALGKLSMDSRIEPRYVAAYNGMTAIIALDHGVSDETVFATRLALSAAGMSCHTVDWTRLKKGCANGYDVTNALNEFGPEVLESFLLACTQPVADIDRIRTWRNTDEGNAELFSELHANQFAWSGALGWTGFDGTAWSFLEDPQMMARVQAFIRRRASMGVAMKGSDSECKAILSQMRACMFAPQGRFDAAGTHHLLPTPSGTVNLRTGEMTDNSAADFMLSRCATPFDLEADPNPWHEFVASLVGDDQAAWLQLALGYSLTGYANEQFLTILQGKTRSGKGTLQRAFSATFGESIVRAVGFESFTKARGGNDQGFDLAGLRNARLVFASEGESRAKLNTSLIKRITGEDPIHCALKGKDFFEFMPRFSIFLATNFMPLIDPDDTAAWGRIRIVEFGKSYLGHEDTSLSEKFGTLPWRKRILRWVVDGSRGWFEQFKDRGRRMIDVNEEKRDAQRHEQDQIAQWLVARVRRKPGVWTAQASLWADYDWWCARMGYSRMSQKGFGIALNKKDFQKDRKTSGMFVEGIEPIHYRPDHGYEEGGAPVENQTEFLSS